MRILTRYLLRAHTTPFLFALTVLTGLLFVNTVARRFPVLAGKGLPMSVILQVMGLSIPHILALTLPMAVLVAVLYSHSQMTADNEVTAMKASGISLLRMLAPLVVASALLAGGMVYFNHAILPESNHRLATLLTNVNATTPTLALREDVLTDFHTADYSNRFYLKAAEVRAEQLRDVVIYDMSNPATTTVVYADSGRMVFNRDKTDLFLTLYDGRVDQLNRQKPQEMERVFFTQQMMQLDSVGSVFSENADTNYRSDREMSLTMLQTAIDTARKQLAAVRAQQTAQNDNAGISSGGPADSIARAESIEALQLDINSYTVEWHKKFAIPIACIIFVLIGAPIAVRFPRGGVGMVIFISMVIFAIYYMSLIGGETLGDRGDIPPFMGPWAPNILFGVIGVIAVARIGRETATSRGGDWDDMKSSIAGLFRR